MERSIRKAKVAVCGGAGFLGSHLVKHLIEDRECEVVVLDNLIAGNMKFVHPQAKFIWCDITHSESELRRIFETHGIEYVFNYAASPYIPVSFERPLHVFDINARGALNVLNAAQSAGVKGILQVSSAEIYGDAPEHKIDETYPANPHSTYGASKLAIDCLVQARWHEAKTPAIALRQFNCLGENETHPYVIPEIIRQISRGGTPIDKNKTYKSYYPAMFDAPTMAIKLGNNSFRDFQYAGDAVRMATELLEKGKFGEVYNMGSESGIMIYNLAQNIGTIMHENVLIEVDESRVRPWEIWHLQSDNTKLYNTITYRPQVSLEDALLRVVNDFWENGFCFK